MSIKIKEGPSIWSNVNLGESFQDSERRQHHFTSKNLRERLLWAHQKYGEGLVLTSSFGVQSLILLNALKESGLDIPVVCVDIPGSEYDKQRAYRHKLQEALGFNLVIAPAVNKDDKDGALDRKLQELGATALLSGVRFNQTALRADMDFVEEHDHSGTIIVEINPILDWSDEQVYSYLERSELDELRHAKYREKSTGGVVLGTNETKTECPLRRGRSGRSYRVS